MIQLMYDIVGVTAYLDLLIDKIYFPILLPLNSVLYCLEDNISLEAELFGRIASPSVPSGSSNERNLQSGKNLEMASSDNSFEANKKMLQRFMNAKKQQLISKIEVRAKIKLDSLLRYYRLTVFHIRNGLTGPTDCVFFSLCTVQFLAIFKFYITYLEQSERKDMIQSKKNSQ